jgi:hypothetical protein
MNPLRWVGIGLVAPLLACSTMPDAARPCDRACLLAAAERYFAALARREPDAAGLAARARITENGVVVTPAASVLARAHSVQWHQSFVDPRTSQVAAFQRHEDAVGPVLYAVRLKLQAQRIVEVEALVNHRGAHPFFAPQALNGPRDIFDRVEPVERRRPREQLRSIANSYFDAIEQHSGSVAPFHADCTRIENGVRTTDNPQGGFPRSCRAGMQLFTYIPRVRDRSYPVVDDERGIVVAWAVFDMPGTVTTAVVDGQTIELPPRVREPKSMRLAEVFKIVDGQLHTIEAFIRYEPLGVATGWPP